MKREIALLSIIILNLLLGVSLLFKFQILTNKILIENKDVISIFKDFITFLIFIIGAVYSYFRFFKGRTFSSKGDVSFSCTAIETPNDSYFHVVTLRFENIGNFSIWNPVAKIMMREYDDSNNRKEQLFDKFYENSLFEEATKNHAVVEPDESAYFIISKEFPKSVYAISFTAEISAKNGRTWKKSITIANKPSK